MKIKTEIEFEMSGCHDCPFLANYVEDGVVWCLRLGASEDIEESVEEKRVADNCPFLKERLQKALNILNAMRYLERKNKEQKKKYDKLIEEIKNRI